MNALESWAHTEAEPQEGGGDWMRKDEGDTIGLYFKVSPEETEVIKEKMELAGTASKRAYLRKWRWTVILFAWISRSLRGL